MGGREVAFYVFSALAGLRAEAADLRWTGDSASQGFAAP